MLLFIEQCLNGLQFGLLLFLLAAGLTLVFGIMDLVNLAHGSLYMMGAYFAATFAALTGSFVLGARARAGGDAAGRHGGRGDRAAAALRPRPSRPGARHLRADPVLQRAGAADLGAGGPATCRCRPGSTPRSRSCPACYYPAYRFAIIVVGAGGRAAALCPRHAHAHRHADPRRRLEPRDGRRARHQHQAALHAGVRARRRARRACRPDAGADPDRADRHGREHPDPRLRRHRHRRHRLDPRRVRRRRSSSA